MAQTERRLAGAFNVLNGKMVGAEVEGAERSGGACTPGGRWRPVPTRCRPCSCGPAPRVVVRDERPLLASGVRRRVGAPDGRPAPRKRCGSDARAPGALNRGVAGRLRYRRRVPLQKCCGCRPCGGWSAQNGLGSSARSVGSGKTGWSGQDWQCGMACHVSCPLGARCPRAPCGQPCIGCASRCNLPWPGVDRSGAHIGGPRRRGRPTATALHRLKQHAGRLQATTRIEAPCYGTGSSEGCRQGQQAGRAGDVAGALGGRGFGGAASVGW
jgi:hypothetical protein